MMKFIMNELKREPSCDWVYLVKAVTNHIIGDRCSWGLRFKATDVSHPICQAGADGIKIVFGLTIHIETIASDIVRNANADVYKH